MIAAKIDPETGESYMHMVMSVRPDGRAVITITISGIGSAEARGQAENLRRMGRACLDAIATEVVDQTQAGFENFLARNDARCAFPSLAAYPRARA